jgi:hypothetical protein
LRALGPEVRLSISLLIERLGKGTLSLCVLKNVPQRLKPRSS